jgi:hypothetical protein
MIDRIAALQAEVVAAEAEFSAAIAAMQLASEANDLASQEAEAARSAHESELASDRHCMAICAHYSAKARVARAGDACQAAHARLELAGLPESVQPLLICPDGQLSAADKALLEKGGMIRPDIHGRLTWSPVAGRIRYALVPR